MWNLNLSRDGEGANREEFLQKQAEEGDLTAIRILSKRPNLSNDPDLRRLLRNFGILSQTRSPGFNGPGALRLRDILALYEVEGWVEAEMTAMQFIDTMLFLDTAFQEFHAERRPATAK